MRENDKAITFRLPSKLWAQIERLAVAEERSDSAMMRWLLRTGIAAFELERERARRAKARARP